MRMSWIVGVSLVCLLPHVAAQGQTTVGTYYYPWWGDGMSPATGHTWDQSLRAHMTPNDHAPAAGYTASNNPATIAAHIEQSLQANISMWSLSWWGPTSREDAVIRNAILTHPDADKLQYSIHYESQGRLGSFDSPDFSRLQSDFRHLADHVFDDPNYMTIDGRPVVFMYLSRVYLDTPAGRQAIGDLRAMMQNEYGYDPYIIGDDVFGSTIDLQRAAALDAITTYDVYAASGIRGNDGNATQAQVDQLAGKYAAMKAAAESLGIDYVPAVSPGFNDRGVRDGNPAATSYLQELGPTAMGSLLEALLEDAALPNTDSSIQSLVMVNSFNEWHEDTQIEATVVVPASNTDDSPTGEALTQGKYYEGYGTRYLDILRQSSSGDVEWNGSAGDDAGAAGNWDDGFAPRYGDRAVFNIAGHQTVDVGAGARWGSMLFGGEGSTTLSGDGVLTLTAGPDALALASTGGPRSSVVDVAIDTAGVVRGDHGHNLTFNRAVTAGKIEAFNGATVDFHTLVTATGGGDQAFISGNAGSTIRFHGGFTTTHTSEFGLNGGGAVYASSFTTPDSGNHVVNLFDGQRLGSLADNAFQDVRPWARTDDGILFDLNGFSDAIEYLGTNSGVTFTIDFGDESGSNRLDWVTSHNMNGQYAIVNFEIGLDQLQLGAAGDQFFSDEQLHRITINGIGYSAEPTDEAYWTRDANNFVQFIQDVPEPASLTISAALLLLVPQRR